MTRFTFSRTAGRRDGGRLVDFVSRHSGLSKRKIKEAMHKGALWRKRGHGRYRRVRRALAPLESGDAVRLYYDEKLLSLPVPDAVCLQRRRRYSVWWKPAGLLTQGTRFTDHVSLLRQVEKRLGGRNPYPVHRLDRETMGAVIVAHDSAAAAELSALFRRRQIVKGYRAEVCGDLTHLPAAAGRIEQPLDGKKSLTEIVATRRGPTADTTVVDMVLHTGRTHQIRRHLAHLGFPVLGDPRYGKGNRHPGGLQLVARSLDWRCPFSGVHVCVRVPSELMPPALANENGS